MSESNLDGPPMRRGRVRIGEEHLTRTYHGDPDRGLPLTIEAVVAGVRLVDWAVRHRAAIEAALLKHGAVLFRGFRLLSIAEFQELIGAISGQLLEYINRSSPRTQVDGLIYTSTEYPADQTIPLHNELAYTRSWPDKIFFFCIQPAERGGETPIADSRRVFQRIHPAIREKFIRLGVMYVRNYGGMDLPWQEVFQTTEKSTLEAYCRSQSIDVEWKSDGHPRTRQTCQAAIRHPQSGEMTWFNQAHLFHISGLPPHVQQSLLSMFEPDDLPRNAYYGDGSVIEVSVLDEIRAAYDQEQSIFTWRANDILALDNTLAAHGRATFSGPRKVVVGMSASPAAE